LRSLISECWIEIESLTQYGIGLRAIPALQQRGCQILSNQH